VGYVESGGGSGPNEGFVTTTLEMDHAPRIGETVVLTCTISPVWDYFKGNSSETKQVRFWLTLAEGIEVAGAPSGMWSVSPQDLPWGDEGWSVALEGEASVEEGEVVQFLVPLRFVTEGPGWGGMTAIESTVWLIGDYYESVFGERLYFPLTITQDFSHFGYPDGFSDAPTYPEGVTPPPTPLPGQVEEAVGTPATIPSPPVVTSTPPGTPRPTPTPEPTVGR
jgi:hypothetical protein